MMLRRVKNNGETKLIELSLKQREMFLNYQKDKIDREWPPLPSTPPNTPETFFYVHKNRVSGG